MWGSNENEKEILAIVNDLSPVLPERVRANVAELARAREWGIAVEVLSEMLHEDSVRITDNVFHRIKRLAQSMKLDDAYWKQLGPLVDRG